MTSYPENLIQIISASPVPIAVLDTKMCYIAVSRKWIQDYGLGDKEIIGHSHYELFPEIGPEWKAIHADCLGGNPHSNQEDMFIRSDGSIQWIRWDISPWRDGLGNIAGMVMYSEDITASISQKRELQRNLRLYEDTNEAALIGSWEIDLIDHTIFWSPMIRQILELEADYQPDINSSGQFLQDGKNKILLVKLLKGATGNFICFDEEMEIKTVKGNKTWVKIRGNTEYKDGKCVRVFGTIQDIQGRKLQNLLLEDSERKYKSIIENSLNPHFLIQTDGLILEANKAAEDTFGYNIEEFRKLGRSGIMDLSDPNLKKFIKKRSESGYAKAVVTGIRKNGEHFPIEITSVMFNDSKETEHTSVSMVDITERMKTEESLRLSEEQFRSMFENIQDVFYQTDKNGIIVEISPSIKKHSGYSRKELLGRQVDEFYIDIKERHMLLDALSEHKAIVDFEVQLKTKSGEKKYSSVNAQLIVRNGEVIGIEGSMRDVTERKFQEDALKQLNSDLGLLNDQKNKLLSVIAHDLRNPISGCVALLDVVFMDIETTKREELIEYMTMMQKSILNAHELLEDLLEWARIQFHTVDFNVTSVTNLRGQVKHCLNKLVPIAEAKDITIIEDIEDGVKIRVDKYMLDSILRNLVTNAVKFTNREEKSRYPPNVREKDFYFQLKIMGLVFR